jgi:hypothetical protein
MDIPETRRQDMGQIDLDENTDKWRAVVNTVMNRAVGRDSQRSIGLVLCVGLRAVPFSSHFTAYAKEQRKKRLMWHKP